MLIVYFINPNKLNLKLFFFFPAIGALIAIFKHQSLNIFSSLTSILPEFIGYKINLYILLLDEGKFSDINLFNFLYLSLIFIYYFSLLNYKRMKSGIFWSGIDFFNTTYFISYKRKNYCKYSNYNMAFCLFHIYNGYAKFKYLGNP